LGTEQLEKELAQKKLLLTNSVIKSVGFVNPEKFRLTKSTIETEQNRLKKTLNPN
jgi:hypothetical protein